MPAEPAPVQRHRRRARARQARRLRHHRPHLARGRDQARRPGRRLPAGARRRPGGLQLLRLAARQPRGDDARHLREHPPAQPARAGHRGRRHAPPARAASRCRSSTRRCATAARAPPLVVLGGKEYGSGSSRDWAAKGTQPARRARGDRRELRAHPPLQPRRHGRAAAAVPRGRRTRRRSGSPARRSSRSPGLAEPAERRRAAARGRRSTPATSSSRRVVRIDTPKEADYFRHGGILPYVLRQLVAG